MGGNDPQLQITNSTNQIIQVFENHLVHSVALTLAEYFEVSRRVQVDDFLVGTVNGDIYCEYLLLVRRDSGIKNLPDLKGRSLSLFDNPSMCLSVPWLDVFLSQNGLGTTTAAFFGKMPRNVKLSPAVLRVFFRQDDACLVTRNGYNTLLELNPQLGNHLQILASSSRFITTLFCFLSDSMNSSYDSLANSMLKLDESPTGKQILMMFKTEKLVRIKASDLEPALELLAQHEGLVAAPTKTEVVQNPPKREGKGKDSKK